MLKYVVPRRSDEHVDVRMHRSTRVCTRVNTPCYAKSLFQTASTRIACCRSLPLYSLTLVSWWLRLFPVVVALGDPATASMADEGEEQKPNVGAGPEHLNLQVKSQVRFMLSVQDVAVAYTSSKLMFDLAYVLLLLFAIS